MIATAPSTGRLSAQDEPQVRLALGSGSALQGQTAEIPLTLSTNIEFQGVVAIFEWEDTMVRGVDMIPGEVLEDADVVVRRVEQNFMVLGVVVDDNANGLAALPAGTDIELARTVLRCRPGNYEERSTPLRFRDNGYAAVENGPLLDNIVVIDAAAIGAGEGLELSDGHFQCTAQSGVELAILPAANEPGSACGTANVVMRNPVNDVEGFVLAITHEAGLRLEEISIEDTATAEFKADFVQPAILEEGGTLGVVLDLVSPIEGNVIPAAAEHLIAKFNYCCVNGPTQEGESAFFDLKFVDGVLGVPKKDNLVVIGGVSTTPVVQDRTFTCQVVSEICDDSIDNDGNGLVDCDDPVCASAASCLVGNQVFAMGTRRLNRQGNPDPIRALIGSEVDLEFFYKSPEDFVPGGPQFDQVQGVSMVVCFPCALQCREESFTNEHTIVHAVDADFVDLQCDNTPNDGDGCELILGILVDAMPPFTGGTLPPTDTFLSVGTATFDVLEDPKACGQTLPIEFCDGANGRGNVPIANLVSAENQSIRPMVLNTTVEIYDVPRFFRGDCDSNGRVNVSDAANVVLTVFGDKQTPYIPPCYDACDCNDDGRVDFADTICILRYLFQYGRAPLPPGPGWDEFGNRAPPGEDPTEDNLDCVRGSSCQGA